MKVLITGSNGLLGQKIVGQCVKDGVDFLATSLGENRNSRCPESDYSMLDITDEAAIAGLFKTYEPDVVINTAAMTNVDACEADEVNCRKINVEAVRLLFEGCRQIDAHFIQLSTDFVFDGENGPYSEEDARNPLSIYAQSKADAEDLLTESTCENWAILRTIIVFGEGENLSRSNIVLWARQALREGKPLSIVNDQFRAPTWADDLAWACLQTGKIGARGVFHIAGPETVSIYDLVKRIGAFYDYDTKHIQPVSSETLNQKAKRPPKTGFDLSKARKILGYKPMILEESLALLSG